MTSFKKIAERERAPIYIIGEVTGDHQFTFENSITGEKPIDIPLESLFGDPPKTTMNDNTAAAVLQKARILPGKNCGIC